MSFGARRVEEEVALTRSFALMETNLLSFECYVPRGVVRLLASRCAVAAGFLAKLALAEALEQGLLIRVLAEYLQEMSACVEDSGGTAGEPGPRAPLPGHRSGWQPSSRHTPAAPRPRRRFEMLSDVIFGTRVRAARVPDTLQHRRLALGLELRSRFFLNLPKQPMGAPPSLLPLRDLELRAGGAQEPGRAPRHTGRC